MSEWRTIDSAPMDGSEILGWREDCGIILIRWTSLSELLSEQEIENSGIEEEWLFATDWFWADFVQGEYRLQGSETPTHWIPLPDTPCTPKESKSSTSPVAPASES